jgi:hypothetical protein
MKQQPGNSIVGYMVKITAQEEHSPDRSIVETKKKLYFGAMVFQISIQKYPFPPHRI